MRRAILLATAASALAFSAHAEDEPTEVGEVIVTTTRLPAPQPEVAGAYVIEADRIQDSGAVLAADILSEIPGVSLYNQGPFGGVTSVRLRGAGQDKTLVLLDGVPLNDPSQPAGGYDCASLERGDIERIEVVSGPGGAVWGANAVNGVVNVRSRRAHDTPDPAYLTADLRSPAEHDPQAAAVRVTPTERLAADVARFQAEERVAKFAAATQNVGGCGGAERIANEFNGEVVQSDQVPLRQLPAALQEMMLPMQVGQATRPFGSIEEGVRTLVICGRDEVDPTAPTYDQVMNQLSEERVNTRARRYLRDLRRDAVIEFR